MTWRREMVSILVSVLLPEELVSLVSLAVFWPDLRRSFHYQDKPQYFTLKYSARMSLTGSRARLLLSISMWSSVLFFSSFIIFNPNLSWWNMNIKNKTEMSINAAAKFHLISNLKIIHWPHISLTVFLTTLTNSNFTWLSESLLKMLPQLRMFTWLARILGPVSDVSSPLAETNSRLASALMGSMGGIWEGDVSCQLYILHCLSLTLFSCAAGAVLGLLLDFCASLYNEFIFLVVKSSKIQLIWKTLKTEWQPHLEMLLHLRLLWPRSFLPFVLLLLPVGEVDSRSSLWSHNRLCLLIRFD